MEYLFRWILQVLGLFMAVMIVLYVAGVDPVYGAPVAIILTGVVALVDAVTLVIRRCP